MSELNLKYLKKSDFGGMRSRRGKRKPNQLFVYDIAIQCFDFPRGPHFNRLPVQLILEIFKCLWAYELLRKVSLVCKYWYNLCRDRAIWTSITWNWSPRTLVHLLQLTKYQVHELVLTDNLFTFSDYSLVSVLKKCTHLKCLKLPQNACRELFEHELPRINIIIGWISYDGFSELWDDGFSELWDDSILVRIHDLLMSDDDDEINLPSHHWKLRRPLPFDNEPWKLRRYCRSDNKYSILACIYAMPKRYLSACSTPTSRILTMLEQLSKDIEMALASVEHKRFLTPEEFISQHIKGNRFSQHPDKDFSIELESLERVLQHDRVSRSVRIYETATKSPRLSSIRNISCQDCRMDRRQHQPCKRKPRPLKGRSNQHKEVRKFRRLQKRFKVYSEK